MANLSVIVPVYNEIDSLQNLLDSFEEQTLSDDNYEALFIDDHSTDGSEELIAKFSQKHDNVRHERNEENQGAYPSRNVGIQKAQNEVLVFVDGDTILDNDLLEVYHEEFHRRDIVAAVGRSKTVHASKMWEVIDEKHRYAEEHERDDKSFPLFNGRNSAVRKEAAEEIGGFDESFWRGGDEDFGVRLREAGYELEFLTEAWVKHKPERGLWNELKITFLQGEGEYNRDKNKREIKIADRLFKAGFIPAQALIVVTLGYFYPLILLPYLIILLVFYRWRSKYYTQKPYRNIPFRIFYFTLFSTASALGYLKQFIGKKL
jgi:glycosyltransferase involved in cell wall biosynthesis